MGWNEPDKNNDPWRGKNQQPPDLEEVFKRFQTRLRKAILGNKGPASDKITPNFQGSGLFITLISVIVLILWALSGIFIVDPAEQAAILRLGKYVETVGPGPHWIPRLIESKIVANVERVSDYSYSAQMLTKDENLHFRVGLDPNHHTTLSFFLGLRL